MSLSEPKPSAAIRNILAMAGVVAGLAMVSACTVKPLYSDGPAVAGATAGTASQLSAIIIKPVSTRHGQEVRNQLIFLFNGGSGQPATAPHTLDLAVAKTVDSAALVQVTSEDDEPTAGTVTLTANYTLIDSKTGDVLAKGVRRISASYDRPRQEFATLRAERDAENRAARELAELLRLAIAQDLSKI